MVGIGVPAYMNVRRDGPVVDEVIYRGLDLARIGDDIVDNLSQISESVLSLGGVLKSTAKIEKL